MSHNPTILIHQLLYPVTVLGPGKRVGIWFQGCSIQCQGCMSKHMWSFDTKYEQSVDEIIFKISTIQNQFQGVTISGGEPFDQPDGLLNLIKRLKSFKDINILVYTGYNYEFLAQQFFEIIEFAKTRWFLDSTFKE